MPDPFVAAAYKQGYQWVAGVDEAGRGPLAGPVVAAACLLPRAYSFGATFDSKQLTAKKRTKLYGTFLKHPEIGVGIGVVDCQRIDEINILQASLEAMKEAVVRLPAQPDFLLIDGLHPPQTGIPARCIIKGDALSVSIGAASIVAKHYRDELMQSYHDTWPEYGFAKHKGYPTKAHLLALQKYGPCPIHRRSFSPVKAALDQKLSDKRPRVNFSASPSL